MMMGRYEDVVVSSKVYASLGLMNPQEDQRRRGRSSGSGHPFGEVGALDAHVWHVERLGVVRHREWKAEQRELVLY